MKKIFILFLTLTLTLLCSCRSTNENNELLTSDNTSDVSTTKETYENVTSEQILPEREVISSNEENSSYFSSESIEENTEENIYENVSLAIETNERTYDNNTTVISFILYNTKNSKFDYYNDFFLQIYTDNGWKYYSTKGDSIDYEFKIFTSYENIKTVSFDLTKNYSLPLKNGTYRIIQETDYATITSNSFQIVEKSFFDDDEQQ